MSYNINENMYVYSLLLWYILRPLLCDAFPRGNELNYNFKKSNDLHFLFS